MTDANAPTHGGPRPGSGRKHLDGTPPGNDAADPAERHTVTMPASYWNVIKSEGGTYSAGVRMVVEFWLDSIDIHTGESIMRTSTKQIFEALKDDQNRILGEIQNAAKMRPGEYPFEWRDVPSSVDTIPKKDADFWYSMISDW